MIKKRTSHVSRFLHPGIFLLGLSPRCTSQIPGAFKKVAKKIVLLLLIAMALFDCWKQAESWCLKRSQALFKKTLIESGISVS